MSGDELTTEAPTFSTAWHDLVLDPTVSDGAVRLYLVLAWFTRPGKSTVFPGQVRLAKDMDCSLDTVQRRLNELIAKRWVTKTRRHARRTNQYHLRMPRPVQSPPDTDDPDAANLRPQYGDRKNAASVCKKMKLEEDADWDAEAIARHHGIDTDPPGEAPEGFFDKYGPNAKRTKKAN